MRPRSSQRESGADRGADANIVVQVPNRRLAGARIEQQVIRFSVPVKIGRSRQIISRGNRRPKSAANANIVVQVPDHCVTRARIEEQVISVFRPC